MRLFVAVTRDVRAGAIAGQFLLVFAESRDQAKRKLNDRYGEAFDWSVG